MGTLALSVSLWLFMPQRNVGSLQVPNWQNRVGFMSTTSLVTAGTLAAAGATMTLPVEEIPSLVKPMKSSLPDLVGIHKYIPCCNQTSGQPAHTGLGQPQGPQPNTGETQLAVTT